MKDIGYAFNKTQEKIMKTDQLNKEVRKNVIFAAFLK